METFETVIELAVTPTSVAPPLSPENLPVLPPPLLPPDLLLVPVPAAPLPVDPPLTPAAAPVSDEAPPPSAPASCSFPPPPLRPLPNASSFCARVVRDPHAAVARARTIPSTTTLDLRTAPPESLRPGNLTGRQTLGSWPRRRPPGPAGNVRRPRRVVPQIGPAR